MRFILIALLFCASLSAFDMASCKRIPVLHEGRVKPLDTVARHSLEQLHGKQTLVREGKKISAIAWLLDVLMRVGDADALPLIPVKHPDLLRTLGCDAPGCVSMERLRPYIETIYTLAVHAEQLNDRQRNALQRETLALWQRIALYLSLSHTLWVANVENTSRELDALKVADPDVLPWFSERYQFLAQAAHFSLLPPRENSAWQSMGEALLAHVKGEALHPSVPLFVRLIEAYQQGEIQCFDRALHEHLHSMRPWMARVQLEVLYNGFQPFFVCGLIYASVVLSALLANKKTSFFLLLFGFAVHSLGLMTRMMLEGRPPVTNLYSSALFVGWSTVLFSLFLDKRTRGIVGAIVGLLTLLVAHFLAEGQDTLEAMRAVLNSNLWLSIHVVTIALGYGATFLAGGIASTYIVRNAFAPLDGKCIVQASQLVYRCVCLSMLLTVSGTIFGGFWADQSWGRFWGWDPKENGALVLILWNAIIVHARLGNLIQWKGLLAMAALGNALAALSWFGVNLLSVGFHSYGFFSGSVGALSAFVLGQCAIAYLTTKSRYLPK